jgi:hypothetical protein
VSSASESQVENNHPTQAGVVEAPEVTDTDTPNDSPEFDLSALPNFINDTQPVHRDITDGPAVAIDIPTLSESAATVEDSNATNEALVTTTDAVTTGLKLDEMGELVTSHDNADTGDTTTSLELPTLSDSMRIVISAEDPEVEPALALDVAPDADIDEEETEAEIFNQIDPLPDSDASDEAEIQTDHVSSSAIFTDNDGAISVPNLTIANNFDKSKNDIDALEAVLEAVKQGKISAPIPIKHELATELNGRAPMPEAEPVLEAKVIDIPQITLDDELNKLAQEIGTADSLTDFSASMAETLFGSEAFEETAAHVAANPTASGKSPVALVEDASPVRLMKSDVPAAVNDKDEKILALEAEVPAKPAPSLPRFTSNPPIVKMTGEIDLSASMAMRIDILNKAKDNVAGTAVENVEISLRSTSNGIEKPESIENQINTSIMQTLKAIDIKNMAKLELEEKLQKKSDGLFSRFRKSS